MMNSAYWRKRFAILEKNIVNKGIDYYNSLAGEYEKAMQEIQKEIEAWFVRYSKEEGISLTDAKKILTSSELKTFQMDINEYIAKGRTLNYSDEWRKELERISAKVRVSRLEEIQTQLRQRVESIYASESDGLNELLSDVFSSGYYHTAYEIQKGLGVGWSLSTINESVIQRILSKPWAADGTSFSERIWGKHRPQLMQYLKTELTQTIIRGEAPQDLINKTAKKFGTARSQAASLIMTELSYFSSAAQKQCFTDLNIAEYEIVATLDMKTSEICRDMDKNVFKMSEFEVGVTAPPFHVRCRTVTAPHFDDEFSTDNMRFARGKDGKSYYVPASMTYKEWFEEYVK